MKQKIKAIFFDLDETLFSTSSFTQIARRNAMQAMIDIGLKIPLEILLNELKEVVHEFTSNYGQHFDKLLLRIPEQSYAGINKAILIAAAVIAYHDTKYEHLHPYEDACEFLERLAILPLIRGVITAGLEVKQAEKLLRLQLYHYFTPGAIFISEQIGISKPNPKLYEKACRCVGIAPEQTVYVGDNPTMDIDPANSINMITVRMDKGGKYHKVHGKTVPHYDLNNFWALWDILQRDFDWD